MTHHDSLNRSPRRETNERILFCKYFLFAFCVPIILTLFDFAIDQLKIFPSHFGEDRCWAGRDRMATFCHLYAPITLVLLITIAFYLATARKIYKQNLADDKQLNDQELLETYRNIVECQVRFVMMAIILSTSTVNLKFHMSDFSSISAFSS